MHATLPTSSDRAPRSLVIVLAVSAGATVANLYYNQPLLAQMAHDLGASERDIGAIPTLTQLGYGLAMLLLVPLGDRYERRGLIVRMTAATVVALGLVATASSLVALAGASLLLGAASMIPQYLVPYAAGAARPEERGRVVGTVMSGLLIGILLSRTISGVAGAQFGWRAVYIAAAALMGVFALGLRAALPLQPPEQEVSLRELYTSLYGLVRDQPALRVHSVLGALSFACFSVFWSTLAFHLATPPLHYGSAMAGAFGILGVAGALAAAFVGRLADTRDSRSIARLACLCMLVSFAVFAVWGESIWGVAAGVVLLDLGTQANQINNQARVYALAPAMRNRLNTIYMSTYFAGGALGSGLGTLAWSRAGWTGVCTAGAALSAAAFALSTALGRVLSPRARD